VKIENLPHKGRVALPHKGRVDAPNLPHKGRVDAGKTLPHKGRVLLRSSYQEGAVSQKVGGGNGLLPRERRHPTGEPTGRTLP
jgi:hypothetical protein